MKLLDWAMNLALQEESKRERVTYVSNSNVIESSRFLDLKYFRISSRYNVIKLDSPGQLKEFICISPSPSFEIEIQLDDFVIRRSYIDLEKVSSISEYISVYEENGKYYLNLMNLSWSSRFSVNIFVNEPIVFERIFAIYTVRV